MSGRVPFCLGTSIPSLVTLMLKGNKLSGTIPQAYTITSALRMIDLSNNSLQGELPRALVNCTMLEFLDVSHNQIIDTFPCWLGALPELKVISLHHNQLYGSIDCPTACAFSKIHIIDLSHNEFTGSLPSEMIQGWKSMKTLSLVQLQYESYYYVQLYKDFWVTSFDGYSFTMSNKGTAMVYERLQEWYYLISIDPSSNRISGKISDAMGELKGLYSLNLSNNTFSGSIPSSFGELSYLESLDLSLNNFSGKIPHQLTQLTFLSFFNVSFNSLSGLIPENKQFGTFQGNSFQGNQGLCGNQLMKKCVDTRPSIAPPSTFDGDQDPVSFLELYWEVVLIGYGGGLVTGLVLGSTYSPEIFEWLKRIYPYGHEELAVCEDIDQFHYVVFFANMKLSEQEIMNLMWISEYIADQNQKPRVPGIVVFIF
ncbi:hypothetical protein RJT34_18241 [Clitoria ternatea]|uniref:Uncharacterized protein n=1 Tax=Clitoria ternatea TaxID=43366 RepID=A0AAN9JBN8_CLITE